MLTASHHAHLQRCQSTAAVARLGLVATLALVSMSVVPGCDGTADEPLAHDVSGPIINNALWVAAHPDSDPFAAHRASMDEAGCDKGTILEGEVLEVDTGQCHYLHVRQGLAMDLAPGRALRLAMFHAALVPLGTAPAGEKQEGHAALSIDGEVVWERWFQIPQGPAPYTDEIAITRPFSAGDEVVFHLHNHGANTWKLLSVEALPTHPQ